MGRVSNCKTHEKSRKLPQNQLASSLQPRKQQVSTKANVALLSLKKTSFCVDTIYHVIQKTHRSTKNHKKMISDDKSDPHSGSESSASEELSQHSNSIATSLTSPIIAAFTNSNSVRRSLGTSSTDSTSVVSLASSESFGLNDSRGGHHHIAHYTPPTSNFF